VISGLCVFLLYFLAVFAEFFAPYCPETSWPQEGYAPPQTLHWFRATSKGLIFQPSVFNWKITLQVDAMRRVFVVDRQSPLLLHLWVHGEPYKLLGIIPGNVHLFGPAESGKPVFILGADRIGRDVFSRLIYGARTSLSIGLVGVLFSLVLGVFIGGISGYYGGTADLLIQRAIEFLRSIPTIPLWMGLAAALPRNWGPSQVYFGITIILSLMGWTWMARVVRSRFLALRTEDFITAARLDGVGELRIIFRHMLPSFASHMIATITLNIPTMILSETALSFLGLGLRSPAVSWGVLLQDAQNIRTVATAPWLLVPGLAVALTVLAMNFLGDGLRDAADPYST